MAKTEEKRKFKDLSDAEKYRFLKESAIKIGFGLSGIVVGFGIGTLVYFIGKEAGMYSVLEDIYNKYPECATVISEVDPAFFAALKK